MKGLRGTVVSRGGLWLVLALFSLVTLVPFAWIVLTSLKSPAEIVANGPIALPSALRWQNYPKAWIGGRFGTYYVNSIVVAAATIAGVSVLSLLAAYAFAYKRFFLKGFWFSLIVFGLLIPGELTVIPLFHDLRAMGLLNGYGALILPQVAGGVAFGVFLMRGFMKSLPPSLLEAARIDGATEGRVLVGVIVPLVKPALVSLVIFTLISSWNNFMLPTIMIQSDALRTVPIGLNAFRTKYSIDFCLTAAGAVIVALPVMVAYSAFQKTVIQGMTMGALKE